MTPYDIEIPKDQEALARFYIAINSKINEIWMEYTRYCEGIVNMPKCSLIFPIIFNEIDFYETLLSRIRVHLTDESLRDIRHEEDFSNW